MSWRATLRIARWEVTRSAGTVDRRTLIVLVLAVAVVGPISVGLVSSGLGLEDGIYRIDVPEDSPYAAIVEENDQFVAHEDAQVVVRADGRIGYVPTPTGEAALAAFRDAIVEHNDRTLIENLDDDQAYPVYVTLTYQTRNVPEADGEDAGASPTGSNGGENGGNGGGQSSLDPAGSSEERLQVPAVGAGSTDGVTQGTPGAIAPPFPFRSLVLAFLFVVPMNFVIQAYGSTIVDERVKRRGELLLVAPVSRWDVITGKTLPYLLALIGISAVIARAVGGGPMSVAAVVPIALCFLAATFVGAMFARSFKELTFVTVSISVGLTTYVFVPAIFTDVLPIALISPLSIVVLDLRQEAVTLGQYAFSTGPFYLCSVVLFALGASVYREEDMFSQKAIPAKLLDALAGRLRSKRDVALVTLVSIPFVFAAQLLVIALLFALPIELSIPILLVAFAAIEELAKSVHVYAGFARSRFEPTVPVALALGCLSGGAFFLAEKVTLAFQLVGLPELDIGEAAVATSAGAGLPILVGMLLAPLLLHVVTTSIVALGAMRGRTAYGVAFASATVVHAAYNFGVISYVGF